MKDKKDRKIGFIGQGFIGRNLADDFVARGFTVVRYALEGEFVGNREAIADCDVVFIAVPTPTTPQGFDSSILEKVISLVGVGKLAIIKSTVLPGTTRRLQKLNPSIKIMHTPEFLRERFAALDTQRPERNIIGVLDKKSETINLANEVLNILPKAEFESICTAEEAEIIKYGGNCFLALKVVYMNLLYELAQSLGANYETIAEAIGTDKRIGHSHTKVLDASGENGQPGRGAGGHCFPKDLAAFRESYENLVKDHEGLRFIKAFEAKNFSLLEGSGKDLELLKEIYGS